MGLASALFPVPCVGCGTAGAALCADCLAAFEPARDVPIPAGLDTCAALTTYCGVARQVIAGVKYRNDRSALGLLAVASAQLVGHLPVDAVCWVPTVASHRRGRGFDQAELLARQVGRALRVPTRRLLGRVDGPSQTGRDRASRARPTPFAIARTAPCSVLLVDDVVTTGATLAAAAHQLRRGGADVVHGLALAHTPAPSVTRSPR